MLKRFVRYYRPHLGLLILDLISAVGSRNDLIFPSARAISQRLYSEQQLKSRLLYRNALLILYRKDRFSYIINYWGHRWGHGLNAT